MDIGKSSERLMGMTDAVWERHANPISGWSRVATLPLLAAAIWSRDCFGWRSLLPFAYGLYKQEFWATVAGLSVMMIAKLWFLDRMVWLFDDMKDGNAEYLAWLRK